MATPVSPSHLAYSKDVLVNFTSRLDLRSIGRLSCTDKALHQAVTTGPLLYVRIQAKLGKAALPAYAGEPQERLDALVLGFVSRASLRCNLPEFQQKANSGWHTAAQILSNSEPLRVLENIAANFSGLIDEGASGKLRLELAVQSALKPEVWSSNCNAAIDACAAPVTGDG